MATSYCVIADSSKSVFIDHFELKQKIENYLSEFVKTSHQGKFRIKVGNIDNRLKLKSCSTGLKLEVNRQFQRSRSVTVSVQCQGDKPWRLYVPSQVLLYKKVLVAKQPIKRGVSIAETDIATIEREVTNLYFGYLQDPKQVIGKVASRMIMPGTLLRPQILREAILINRGELVTIVAEVGGISVKMNGRAVTSGGRGRQIKVQNLSSRRIVEGVVIGKGIVKISL